MIGVEGMGVERRRFVFRADVPVIGRGPGTSSSPIGPLPSRRCAGGWIWNDPHRHGGDVRRRRRRDESSVKRSRAPRRGSSGVEGVCRERLANGTIEAVRAIPAAPAHRSARRLPAALAWLASAGGDHRRFQRLRRDGKSCVGVSNFDVATGRGPADSPAGSNRVHSPLSPGGAPSSTRCCLVRAETRPRGRVQSLGHGRFPALTRRGGRVLQEIASAHGATPPRVALRFLVRRTAAVRDPEGVAPEPPPERRRSDLRSPTRDRAHRRDLLAGPGARAAML